jgi:AcrR family transcriptional regulator
MDPETNLDVEIGEGAVSPQKQAILDVAHNLFAQYGYEGLSIRDLAEHCGLAKATIYHHFQDKQDIFLSVLAQDMVNTQDQTLLAAANIPDPLERLRLVAHTYSRLMHERRSLVLPIIHANPEIASHARIFIQRHKQMFLGPLTQIVQECIAADRMKPVDPELAAVCLLGMLNAAISYQVLFGDMEFGQNDSEIADRVFSLYLTGAGVSSA